ncbi:hypothetical protein JAAARDRAFT_34601 [Jaapia argillacea MUCL 33604]|uniref:RNA helicase n=1 Tax=Jaapia argillacea MUCL 33604 TaxID=933084 RepID=A0A067Q826_9AGAM|nr:hypothetical protein JAAARDRAFT_34601 [Jaapia argillacea MUCL 33604]
MAQSKRKLKLSSSTVSASNKRSKLTHVHTNPNDLPWKTVSRSKGAWLGADDGILELEEVEGVEVVYEEGENGKVARFNVLDEDEEHAGGQVEGDDPPTGEVGYEQEPGADNEGDDSIPLPETEDTSPPEETFDTQSLLQNWLAYPLHPSLLKSLHSLSFVSPTPIQTQAIPLALSGRDVIGVAETGSGKTLAYGLPILHYILSRPRPRTQVAKARRKLSALILAPTRELALQVSSHLNQCLNSINKPESSPQISEGPGLAGKVSENKANAHGKGKGKGTVEGKSASTSSTSTDNPHPAKSPPLVSVAAIVGGMSSQKQRRILDRGVDILVATPGRLWDILEDDDTLAKEIKTLKFLVLDEADRMVEAGHFAELDNILRLTLQQSRQDETDPEFLGQMGEEVDESKHVVEEEMQTFVFSATMSKDLQQNLKKRRSGFKGAFSKAGSKPASTLDDLLLRLDFRDPEPEVIDLSPEGGVVSSLRESKVECLSADKDVYLYYFLLRYPGRSLVFLSSIDGIRRLMPLMELLNVKAFPLHSQLEQRQRLKNLDRFKSTSSSVLLATDIAARGLDIPSVDHVIHYQIPRSADVYVHRNGRTARANRSGFSLIMVAPDERRLVRGLMGSLKRDEAEIPELTPDLYLLDKLKARVQLARQIDKAQHKVKKENYEKNWLKVAAEAMEIELDSDLATDSEDDSAPTKKKAKAKVGSLKAELKHLLSQPLVAKGVLAKYITSGSVDIVDDLLAGESLETMLGVKRVEAGSEVNPARKKRKSAGASRKKEEDYEEWNGFGS